MNLPPFPSLPSSPQERLRLIAYGEACFRAGMERAAVICDRINTESGNGFEPFADAIRGEAERKDER